MQGDGTDPEIDESTTLIVMGLDTEDGRGERVIVGQPGKYLKPRLTSKADRIVFSTRVVPGPPEIFIVNWDGSGLRKLADGFALALWRNPADGSDWVYQGTENREYDFARVTRFPIDAPEKRELVWDKTLVSMEGFAVSPDGRFAGGMWPWPNAGVADLAEQDGQETRRRLLDLDDVCQGATVLVFRWRASERHDGRCRCQRPAGW